MALANFIREGDTSSSLLVNFTVGGTATLTTDYLVVFPLGITGTWTATSGNVTIPVGSSQVDVTINPVGDSVLEQNETIIVTLTSTVPSIPVSSSNNAAVLVILNDDFTNLLKVLGVGTTGTFLTGTGSGALSGTNTGTAPANWPNWTVNSTIAGQITTSFAGSMNFTAINLLKAVVRSPSGTPTVGTFRDSVGTTNSLWHIRWVYNSSGTWDLQFLTANVVIFTFASIISSTWVDIIIESTSAGITMILNGTLTQNTLTALASNVASLSIPVHVGAFAAISLTTGQSYIPSMFPITPANL